ncbi:peptidoglycan D,D-transpeptidase FtsI family protein [Bacillus massiliigorillae]|uniref:peptidoglycan D,D-transpeptidase FtsI family protein n=1 Tax=Bacillus massiliigorillae TaxID=1243664 RepID=UPI00039F63DE|nr:penicillin-binding protein 2 [Bacillus massiliigorillae]
MKKKEKRQIASKFRLNLLFFVIFLMFASLILRLGFVQIVKGEEYSEETKATTTTTYKWNAPRGKMYDREGRVVVENEPVYTLTYAKPEDDSNSSLLKTAKKLANLITIDTSEVKDRDKKDYWIQLHEEEARAKVTNAEREKLDDDEEYRLLLKRITDDELNSITNQEMQIYTIKSKMSQDVASASRIKEGLTTEEIAKVNENLDSLPGIEVKLDSKRKYPYGDTFRQIFGNIAQIPAEKSEVYRANGYDLDDTVGKSFLELQYEQLLRGQKEEQVYEKNRQGVYTSQSKVKSGEPGKNIVLTIDMDLQQKVEKIIEDELKKEPTADGAYVVMMNPNTGEILSMAGKTREGATIKDETYGAVYNAYAMGSAVKGATVLTGYEAGVIKPGSTFLDAPIKLKGTPTKKSYTNMGIINDLKALERSSNVYMFHIAMAIGQYDYDTKSGFKNPELAYSKMRKYFAQFGLGAATGIDLPKEATGYNGGVQKLGNLMDLAIGQFDTYTPLQLAQYVSTIANDGKRMQPHFLKEVRKANETSFADSELLDTFTPKLLNKIDMDQKEIERVQEGFRQVMSGSQGTATNYFGNAPYKPAGKTGTAQVYDGKGGYDYNLTLVAYAPYENPEIAISVVVPTVDHDSSSINKNIGRKIMDEYFGRSQSTNE